MNTERIERLLGETSTYEAGDISKEVLEMLRHPLLHEVFKDIAPSGDCGLSDGEIKKICRSIVLDSEGSEAKVGNEMAAYKRAILGKSAVGEC